MDITANSTVSALVVDDSRAMRQLLAAMLRELGAGKVVEASDGAEALALCDQALWPFDLLFCDLSMPGLDGVQTIRHLAIRHPHVTVVPFSGLDPRLLVTVARLAQQLGLRVDGPLAKPFGIDTVAGILQRAAQRRSDQPAGPPPSLDRREIDRALAERRLIAYYQPKIGLRSGEVEGVEALARIVGDDGNIIGPDAFIAVAEQDAVCIEQLTLAIAEQSISQTGIWHTLGLRLDIAINLSAEAIRRGDLPELIGSFAGKAGLAHECVTLELTETRVASGPGVLDALSRFRLQNFGLSVDDFGTGESSLKRLKGLPFTELKVDRIFVHGADHDPQARAILEASVGMAQRLGMKVVAEGVERAQDWQLLEALGCDQAQGFLAARPMRGTDILAFIDAWKTRSLAGAR